MPELPEVETTRRGIAPHVVGRRLSRVEIRQPRLRWPIPDSLSREWPGQTIDALDRRAKYLLFRTAAGTALLHLGMSGSLRVISEDRPPGRHDHVDLVLAHGHRIRFTDPRRFGSLLWTADPPEQHPLLSRLGPEPLGPDFSGDSLYRASRGRRAPVKTFIMDAHVVVGVGNIYASEALYRSGIHPRRPAGRISLERYRRLGDCIRAVLGEAIDQGGTTLRDFVDSSGQPGYFSQQLSVYDRAGHPCPRCAGPVRREVIGQRASYYCANCQR